MLAPSIAAASDLSAGIRFRRTQWRMLGAVMFCYFFYYTGRQTFGFAIPGIQRELGLDKQTLGWVSAGMLWAYAIGQFVNGNLGDRFGGRRMMLAGAVASFALNWLTSFGNGFRSLLAAWSANGLAQSMGWAPGSRLVANWWGAHERGRAFGCFVLAAGLSSVLSYVTSLVVLDVLRLDWRWIFRLPVVLMLVGGLVVWLVARDRPGQLGFAELADEAGPDTVRAPETVAQRYGAALRNGRLLLAGLAIGFQNSARYGLLVWVPVHFLGGSGSKWVTVGLPVGMALGALTSGWISDRFCGSRRSGVIAAFMGLAAISSLLMFALPRDHGLGLPLLFLCGFFAYGPQSAFWALAPDLLGRARTGTAVGVMNCFAYTMAGLGEPLIGWMIERNPLSVGGRGKHSTGVSARGRLRGEQRRARTPDSPMSFARIQLFHGPGRPFELRRVPLPESLASGEVLVEISLATICGSDHHTIEGRRGAPVPCVLGHEAVGRVVASARLGVMPGQRVTWSLADSCGHCPACTDYALPQKCASLFKYGHAALADGSGLNGGYASHILLRRGTAILEVPAELDDAVVAPANCALATIVNVLKELPGPCHTALVQGGGLLGLYACAMLKRRGVENIFCCDPSAQRLALVPEFGGRPVLADAQHWPAATEQLRNGNGGVDLVVEVAGSAAAIPEGIKVLRPGGTYVWAGMVHPDTALALTGEEVVRKCLRIRGVHNYAPADLATALVFLAETRREFPYEKLVSPPLPLDQLDDAVALSQTRQWLRVSVRP